MSMVIKNNPQAMMALRETNKNTSAAAKDLKKLSSGMKINSAGDDASGYAISERMRTQIRSLDQDTANVQNGKKLLNIAAGGIDNIIDELRNLKELAINAANDHNTNEDRATIQKEFDNRMANIDDIASTTNYNGKLLLDGRYGTKITKSYSNPMYGTSSTPFVNSQIEPTGNETTISSGNYTISSDGVYKIASGYTGTITIANGAQNVKITQADPGTALNEVYIEGAPSGNANLWIENLNIKNTQDKSAIKFSGANNFLTTKGTNNFYSDVGNDFEKAIVNVGNGLTVESCDNGSLNIDMPRSKVGGVIAVEGIVGIGSDSGENSNANIIFDHSVVNVTYNASVYGGGIGAADSSKIGDIIINSGTINIRTTTSGYGGGSGIGGGANSRINDIVIKGGAVVNSIINGGGAAVGSGWEGRGHDIIIDNARLLALSYDGAAIGSGVYGKIHDIKIGNSADINVFSKFGAGIGSGTALAEVNDIIIGIGSHINVKHHGFSVYGYDESHNSGGNAGYDIGAGDAGIQTGSIIYTDLDIYPPEGGTATTAVIGNPLVIHHGSKANQALHCYINDMHSESLCGVIPNTADLYDLISDPSLQKILDEAAQMSLADAKVTTRHNATVAIRVVDGALEYALNEATTVGSYISRLDFTEENIVTASENTTAAESAIRDADMAKVAVEFAKDNVLAQASQSMLAQANQNSSSVLSLLQ